MASSITTILLSITSLIIIPTLILWQPARKIAILLLRTVWVLVLLHVEDTMWRKWLGRGVRLPRDMQEVLQDPEKLARVLIEAHTIPEHAQITQIKRLRTITTEPAKNATAGSIRISYIIGDNYYETKTLDLFCKFQTGRGMPKWLQALRAAAEPGICREVDFYAKTQSSVPLRTPKPLVTEKIPDLNYVLLALEYIDLDVTARVVTDAQGANVDEMVAMVTSVAKMHAAFAGGRACEDAATNWIPARTGLEFAKFVDTFMDKKDLWWTPALWNALRNYFHARPVTLMHGDHRPGNCMFIPHASRAVLGVIIADWEAVNIGPFMWDVTYGTTLGWCAESRVMNQGKVLDEYLKVLNAALPAAETFAIKKSDAMSDLALLTLVLGFVSRTIRKTGFWNNQGNTTTDQVAWLARVHLAVADLDADLVANVLGYPKAAIMALQAEGLAEVNRYELPTGKTPRTV